MDLFINLYQQGGLIWSKPEKAKIVVVDASGIQYLVPLFDGESFEIIYTRGERLCLGPTIIWRTIIHYLRSTASLSSAYVLATLETIGPSIVVTFVDNSSIFQNASRLYKNASFVAIQNGIRNLDRDNPGNIPTIRHKEFACFGGHEVEKFTKHGAHVGQFYPVGSLRDSYFRETSSQKMFTLRDLLLVSEFSPKLIDLYPEIENSNQILTKNLVQFCKKTGRKFFVASAIDPIEDREGFLSEVQWYLTHAGEVAEVIPNCREEFTTYKEIDSTAVSLALISTALVEGFGRGNRCLFCNYTGDDSYDFPVPGLWSLKEPSYELFEERLLQLLNMTDNDFNELSQSVSKYVMNYDENMPTHVFLKKLIADALNT